MAETPVPETLPQARLAPAKRARPSAIWLIPMVAAAVAIGIAVERILNEGPTVTIVFRSVEGVEAGKTVVKYKDVNIGQVTGVELNSDFTKVLVTAKMAKSAEGLMVRDARFWIVQPRVTLSGVSGLGTLLSGNYIGFEPGQSKDRERTFVGLERSPAITSDEPGRELVLKTLNLGSIGIGSPIYFRRLQVGKVIEYSLADDGKTLEVRVFVDAPYDRFVSADTRFWNASGLDVSIGAGGVDVRTESLISLLVGGIAFETPSDTPGGEPVASGAVFTLYKDRTTAMKQPEAIARHYVLYSSESLRGLSPGAPITLMGLPAGEVTEVGVDIDPETLKLRGRIAIAAYPERLVSRLGSNQALGEAIAESETRAHAFFQRMIEERGLRAQLRSGNLLTGQLYVAFDFFPDAPKATLDWSREMPVLPMVPSILPDLESKVSGILAKIDALPFEAIGKDVKSVIETFDKALKDVDQAIKRIDTDVTPGLKSAIADLRKTLDSANRAIKSTSETLLGEDAPGQIQLRDALQEVAGAARSIRMLIDYLERQPEALIRGKPGRN